MRFDDRLLTVLKQPAEDRHDLAVRWRQLVDLVARAGSSVASPAVAQALESIRADGPRVDDNLRAAAARAVAALPLPLNLLEYFASDGLSVSAPVLAAATLNKQQWHIVLGGADDETRRFIETLHPELKAEHDLDHTEALVERAAEGRPAPSPSEPPLPETLLPEPPRREIAAEPAPRQSASSGPSLHDVVARIERRRRNRAAAQNAATAVPALSQGSPGLFRWECGPGGEIAWVDGAPRGALIGRSITRAMNGDLEGVEQEVVRAFMLRAPFRDAGLVVAGDGLVSGEWKISGVPAFDPADGRFRGYRGIALRDQAPAAAAPSEPAEDRLADPDSLRELVHEIKTPLNAIIGFAEIIEGQYLGPADRRYRERAMEIVQQAGLLLAAIDDLDFAAKVHSSGGGARRVAVGELVERMRPGLTELAAARGVMLEQSRRPAEASAAVEPQLADRLIFRMCSAMIAEAQPDERLRLTVDYAGDHCRVSITRPAKLAGLTDEQLFGGSREGPQQGFSLRLVRGLARIAGADVTCQRNALSLLFPRA